MKARALGMGTAQGVIVHPTVCKGPRAGKGWQHRTKSYTGQNWKIATGFGIQTGKRSNITVVDVDKPAREWFNKFWAQSGLPYTMQVETPSGGCHLYYRYNPDLKNGQKNFHETDLDIDVRNDGGQIVGPTSPYDTDRPEKMKYKGKLYEYATNENGEKLDWKFIRPLDDIWIRMQQHGINLDTFEIGKGVVKQKVSKPKKKRVFGVLDDSDDDDQIALEYDNQEFQEGTREYNNRRCFFELVLAYGSKFNSRADWLVGIWACCQMADKDGYDALTMADEMSQRLPGYSGLQEVYNNVKSYVPGKKDYLKAVMFKLGDCAARTNFNRTYEEKFYYNDYPQFTGKEFVVLPELHKYFRSAMVKVDSNGIPVWLLRYEGDELGDPDYWKVFSGSGIPFKGDNNAPLNYKKPKTPQQIQIEKDEGKENPETYTIEKTTMCSQLSKAQWSMPLYNKRVFLPFYGELPHKKEKHFNEFSGYRHKPLNDFEYDELVVGDVKKGLDTILDIWKSVLCGGDSKMYKYVMCWLAQLLRAGWKKGRTALVFIGKQGCGKSAMWEGFIMNKIIGKPICNIVTDMKQFANGRFNSSRENKCLHILNECGSCRGKENSPMYDKLKSMITDSTFRCEYKGKEAIQSTDCGSYVLISNHDYSVKVEDDDRRFVVPDIDPKVFATKELKTKYWDMVHKAIDNVLVQRAFFTLLLNIDLSEFNMADIPVSTRRKDLKENKGANFPLHYLRAIVTSHDTAIWYHPKKEGGWYSKTKLRDSFVKFKKDNDYKGGAQWSAVMAKMTRHGLPISDRKKTCTDDKRRVMAIQLDKIIVRDIHRSWLNDPTWDYPVANVTVGELDDADIPSVLDV